MKYVHIRLSKIFVFPVLFFFLFNKHFIYKFLDYLSRVYGIIQYYTVYRTVARNRIAKLLQIKCICLISFYLPNLQIDIRCLARCLPDRRRYNRYIQSLSVCEYIYIHMVYILIESTGKHLPAGRQLTKRNSYMAYDNSNVFV